MVTTTTRATLIRTFRTGASAGMARIMGKRGMVNRPHTSYHAAMARKNQVAPKTFEDALEELERILADIEAGEVPLEESLLKYERGQFLIQHSRSVLSPAEKQIEMRSKSPDREHRTDRSRDGSSLRTYSWRPTNSSLWINELCNYRPVAASSFIDVASALALSP